MNTEKQLEARIKQALENIQANDNGRAWAAFEQRLDQDVPSAPPTGAGSSFDDVISGKLNRIEVPLAASDWGMMEKMIEAEETAELLENEAVIDNLAFEKLERFEVAYQPHHWQMMANRLEEEFFFRYHLLRCKAAEMGLMLLLMLTIARYSPMLNDQLEAVPSTDWPTTPALQPIVPSENKAVKEASPAIAQANPSSKNSSIVSLERKQILDRKPASNTGGTIATNSLAAIGDSGTGDAGSDMSRNNASAAYLPSLGLSALRSEAAPGSLFETIIADKLLNNVMRTPGMDAMWMKNTALLASLDPQPVQSKYAWEVPQLPQRIFEKERQMRFSIFTSNDIAYVITPPNRYSVFDTLISTGNDTTLASGYGGGIMMSWKKGKWEVQTGGIYSFKRYIPNTPVIFFETVNYVIREKFHGVQLDMVQVPLNFNYHLKDQGKWRFYANIGAAGHFITSSVYEIDGSHTPSARNYAMLPIPAGLPNDDTSIKDEKAFPEGLADGGSIYDNFYMTANFGAGMERFVSPRWSLFFQPNYQHYILTDGIGVNNEKLYNFSFYFGTKVSLK